MPANQTQEIDPVFQNRAPLSVTLFNPSGMFVLLSDMLSPLRMAVWLIWPALILAVGVSLNNWYELQGHIERIFLTLGFFQNLLISVLTSNLFSKLMLGTTMAYHGIIPQVFGGRLMFGILPRFFVPKAPIRLLPFPQQRTCYSAPILTKLAMFVFGMVLWAVLRRSGTGAADLFLVLSLTGLGAFLFTVNPLWPADGYRWMSAKLERPQLRKQSMLVAKMVLTRRKLPEAVPRGEASAMLAYGFASVAFTAMIIFSVLQAIGLALEEELSGTGVVLFCVVLAMFTLFIISMRSSGGKKTPIADPRKKQRRAALK